MLNYQSIDKFFERCLVECGLADGWSRHFTLAQFTGDEKAKTGLIKTLHDVQTGADATYSQGKPNESGANLGFDEWERRWNAWAGSRKAAFYSRAALFLLGEKAHFSYFLDILRTSHNLAFLGAANDALQHGTGHYLNGPEEDLTKNQLANWWETQFPNFK
jgi:hypothetical protein